MSLHSPIPSLQFERKRALEACQTCRSRKIRCDVLTRPPCIRCRLEGTACIMTKQKNRRHSSSGTAAAQPQRLAASLASAPLPVLDEQLLFGADSLSASALWPEDDPLSLPSTAGTALPQPKDASSRVGFSEDAFEQSGHGCLSAWDLFSSPPHNQDTASDTTSPSRLFESIPGSPPMIKACRLSHLSGDDLDYLVKKGVFALPPPSTQESLFSAYFRFIHPFLPVLVEDESWTEYEHGLKKMSLLLYRSMLFAACPFISSEAVRELGHSTIAEAQESLFEKARLLFDFETEDNEFTLVSSALLLSFRSPRAAQKSVQKPLYWLSIAISLMNEISKNQEIQYTGSTDYGKLVKRLQWSCAVRELVIALSSRTITEIEPRISELPPLDIEDIRDSTLHSKVYDEETKSLFSVMFFSLTELTRLVVKSRLLQSAAVPKPGRDWAVGDQIVDFLFGIEKASLELAEWRGKFASRFSLATTTSTLSNLKMLVFHRNLALLLCDSFLITLNRPRKDYFGSALQWSQGMVDLLKTQWQRAKCAAVDMTTLMAEVRNLGLGPYLPITMSPIAINSGIVHTLQRPLYEFTQSSDRQENLKLCINVLEEMQQRFPVVNDMIAMLHAAIRFAEQEVAAYSQNNSLSAGFGCGKDLLSSLDQEMIVREAFIISKTIHFLDGLFYKGYHTR